MRFPKSKRGKIALISLGCLAATPLLLFAALIGLLTFSDWQAHQKFSYKIPLHDKKTLWVSGDYFHDTDEVRCRKTTRWEVTERGGTELIEESREEDSIDACDVTSAKPKIVAWSETNEGFWLRLDDVIYHRLRSQDSGWKTAKFDSKYRIQTFNALQKILVLQLKCGVTAHSDCLPRVVMRSNKTAVWKRDERASRQVSEPVLFPFGLIQVQFVWARLPKNWRVLLANWNGQGDLPMRLRKIGAPIIKVETKPFSRRVESVLRRDKWNESHAIIKWNDARRISVHDVFGGNAPAQVGRWSFPFDSANGGGFHAFIRVQKPQNSQRARLSDS